MKIALVHVADHGGGAERSVLTLHQSLLELGHDSRLFVGRKDLDTPGVVEIERRRPIPGVLRISSFLEKRGVQNLYAPWFRRLPDVIGDADVVHIHSIWKNRTGFADLTGVRKIAQRYPTVMTLRDGWMLTGHCACPIGCDRWKVGCGECPDLARTPAIQKDYTRLNWKRKRHTVQSSPLHITAVSSWLKNRILESPIFADKPVHVVHNSVDANAFCPGIQSVARDKLGVPGDRFVALLVGKSTEGMSQYAIAAFNGLNDPEIHPLLVGRAAESASESLNGSSTVIPFRSTQEEMAICYQAADVTIVPSEYETFGRVAAESLFCGTPVVAFATGGLSDIVTPNVCGRLVPTRDVEALMNQIAELKSQPQTLATMRLDCVHDASRRFSTTRIANDYLQVYEAAISGYAA